MRRRFSCSPSLRLLAEDAKKTASDNGSYAGPHGNIDRLLLFNRELARTEVHLFCVPGVGEAAVRQTEDAGHDEKDCNNPDGIHETSIGPRIDPQCRGVPRFATPRVSSRSASFPTHRSVASFESARRC